MAPLIVPTFAVVLKVVQLLTRMSMSTPLSPRLALQCVECVGSAV